MKFLNICLMIGCCVRLSAQNVGENRRLANTFQAVTPTGFTLQAGEISYQNIWLGYNVGHVGLTDWASISVAPNLLAFLDEDRAFGVHLTPTVSLPVGENVRLGVFALLNIPFESGAESVGGVLGFLTIGNPQGAWLTGSYGSSFSTRGAGNIPLAALSGGLRVGERVYLVTEHLFLRERLREFTIEVSTGMLAARWVTRRGPAFDTGIMTIYELFGAGTWSVPVLPYFGFTIPLRRTSPGGGN